MLQRRDSSRKRLHEAGRTAILMYIKLIHSNCLYMLSLCQGHFNYLGTAELESAIGIPALNIIQVSRGQKSDFVLHSVMFFTKKCR